jgi:hypothetical protein
MKFNFGEGLFMRTRMNPIKSILPIITDYEIIKKECSIIYPHEQIKYIVKLFDLDFYRKTKLLINDLGKIEKIEPKKVKISQRKNK